MPAPSPLRKALSDKYARPNDYIDESGSPQPVEPEPIRAPGVVDIPTDHSQYPNTGISGGQASMPQNWNEGPWDAERVRQYFASRGVTPNGSSPDYWAGKWNEWGSRDPNYFLDRLKYADEFIGGPQNSPYKETGGGGGGSVNVPATSAFTNQIREMLLAQLQQAQQPVNAGDPVIASQYDAAKVASDRELDQGRKALAERLYAQGDLNSGSLNQAVQQSAERTAVGLGSLRGNLMAQEYGRRRGEMQNLMQQALASGDAETARAIQMAIANMEADLRRQGYDVTREGYGVQMAQYAQNQNNNIFGAF